MAKIKVSELKGEKLAEWVARACKYKDIKVIYLGDRKGTIICRKDDGLPFYFRPDINGAQAMELQKKLLIDVTWYGERDNPTWEASAAGEKTQYGSYPGIAICRAVVASVYGEYVEDNQ